MPTHRRLAAVLAADVVGYSRLIGSDEERTIARLRSIRTQVVDPAIAANHGRLVRITGDGLLVEFASVIDALRCASEVQRQMASYNDGLSLAERIEYRIGINVGEIAIGDDGDIVGDGVNIAARLEALADAGGICVSARVQEDVAGKLDLVFEDMGEHTLKNIARPVRLYRVLPDATAAKATISPVNRPIAAGSARQAFDRRPGVHQHEQRDANRNSLPTVWPRTSSRTCRNRDRCSSSPAIRASPTKASRLRSRTSAENSVCAMFWKAACARLPTECG